MEFGGVGSQSIDSLDSMMMHGSVETSSSNQLDRKLHILHRGTSVSPPSTDPYVPCPPSLAERMRETHARASKGCTSARYGEAVSRSTTCIERTFNVGSAKAFVHKLANPCDPAFAENHGRTVPSPFGKKHALSHLFGISNATPPTSSGSSSDESQSDHDSTVVDIAPPTPTRDSSKGGESASAFTYFRGQDVVTGQNTQPVQTSVAAYNFHMELPSQRSTPTSGCDLVFLVGDQQYQLPTSSLGLASKYASHRKKVAAEGHSVVDLSTHSAEEWKVVLEFLKPPATDSRGINWSNLPIVLPWFLEFQSLTLLSKADSFLLHNLLGGRIRDGSRGRVISIPNLLKLTRVAIVCGLETTKLQARRFLRQGLLQPRKATAPAGGPEGEQNEDIELEWTLDDLQVLTRMVECFDDLREYLWEYAVIVYLPHDLDVSDSKVLVSNPLFPYLLREGMMQMMIVEGLDAVSSPINDPAFLNGKVQNLSLGSSNSIGSDTTIPTNPASAFAKHQTHEEIELNLDRMIEHLEKFQVEKDLRTIQQLQQAKSSEESFPNSEGDSSPRGNRRRKAKKKQSAAATAGPSRRSSKPHPDTFAC
jgi:hypothetical protein